MFEDPTNIGQKPKELLCEVPDWHVEPGTPLSEFGNCGFKIEVEHKDQKITLPPEAQRLKLLLEQRANLPFFNGSFANVEEVKLDGKNIQIDTRSTDCFSYIAASYAYRDNQTDNPIRPLAVQASVFTPDGEKMILERRSEDVTEYPGALSVFGGALTQEETDLKVAMAKRLREKWGVEIGTEDIIPTGLARANSLNIICPFFMVQLDQDQYQERRVWARQTMREGSKLFYEVSIKDTFEAVKKLLLGKRDISKWVPLGFYNILYALSARELLTASQVNELLSATREKTQKNPLQYKFTMEQYLT